MSVEYRDAFEHLLGQQFRAHAQAHRGPSPLPAQARYQSAHIEDSRQWSIFAKAAALASTKAVVGLIAGVVAVGAAGASEAVITGSGNPVDWVKQVEQQAQRCAISLLPGAPGASDCLNTFLPTPRPHVGNRPPTDGPNTQTADHPVGAPSGKASGGPAADKPGGPPASTPIGSPASGHTPDRGPAGNGHGNGKPQISNAGGHFGSGGPPTSQRPK